VSELSRLRALLLDPEQRELQQHQAAIAELQRVQAALPEQLPQWLDQVEAGPRRESLHRALAPVVAAALTDAVRRDRRSIVDALFPIIGPTIRKAIAEALRAFVADLNRALDYSLTPRGLAWRLESWRSGVPFAQVVMKHTLRYRIDHLFLIERESGLLLHRYSAPELPDLDADAIAGMLTAIGDFVRDSVQSPVDTEGGLASATVGEHLLQVYEGPRAVLACFIRGVPPTALADHLRAALEDLHRQQDETGEGFDWDASAAQALSLSDLVQLSGADAPRVRPARWPMVLILLLLAGLVGAWSWQQWQRQEQGQRLRTLLSSTPGWELLDLHYDQSWQLRLLRDPDSAPTSALAGQLGVPDAALRIDARPFLALDDELLALRARRLLQPPAEVQLGVRGAVLTATGSAPRSWIEQFDAQARWVPGISRVDASLQSTPDDAALARLATLQAALAARQVPFRRGHSELDDAGLLATQELNRMLVEALQLAKTLQMSAQIVVHGWSDDTGSGSLNAKLRAARGQTLQEELVSQGVPQGILRIDASADTAAAPAAGVSLLLESSTDD
jgi:outer membrane protein OmpA-like peptidoglycan-associated protein